MPNTSILRAACQYTILSTAATFILNDDVDSAEAGLAKGTSSYHNVRALVILLP